MRLIDAEDFEYYVTVRYCSKCDTGLRKDCRDTDCWIDYARRTLEELPTIDAKPVVHAHWEKDPLTGLGECCSWCKEDNGYKSMFCPACGAQMDEVTE